MDSKMVAVFEQFASVNKLGSIIKNNGSVLWFSSGCIMREPYETHLNTYGSLPGIRAEPWNNFKVKVPDNVERFDPGNCLQILRQFKQSELTVLSDRNQGRLLACPAHELLLLDGCTVVNKLMDLPDSVPAELFSAPTFGIYDPRYKVYLALMHDTNMLCFYTESPDGSEVMYSPACVGKFTLEELRLGTHYLVPCAFVDGSRTTYKKLVLKKGTTMTELPDLSELLGELEEKPATKRKLKQEAAPAAAAPTTPPPTPKPAPVTEAPAEEAPAEEAPEDAQLPLPPASIAIPEAAPVVKASRQRRKAVPGLLVDWGKVELYLGQPVDDIKDAEAVSKEIRMLRDIQILIARRSANLTLKLTEGIEQLDKIKAAIGTLKLK